MVIIKLESQNYLRVVLNNMLIMILFDATFDFGPHNNNVSFSLVFLIILVTFKQHI